MNNNVIYWDESNNLVEGTNKVNWSNITKDKEKDDKVIVFFIDLTNIVRILFYLIIIYLT